MKAKWFKDITVVDPDTGGEVELSLYKHETGGIFALDFSYIDQVLDEENPVIPDPFTDMDNVTELSLID